MYFGALLTEGGTTAGSMDGLLSSMDTVMSFAGKVLNFTLEQPLLCFFLACGLVGAAVTVISRVKSFAVS